MSEKLEQELKPGFSPEQLIALAGLKVAVKPGAWGFWREAMPDGPEVVEVPVSRIEFDGDGNPVAFGIQHSTMLNIIAKHGDPASNAADLIGIYPNRIAMVAADGQDVWYPPTPPKSNLPGDPFDVPYI